MHFNHEIEKKVILSREISIINYQECCKKIRAKIEATLNATKTKNGQYIQAKDNQRLSPSKVYKQES